MLVTIIIPVFNVADYIERCLISVFNQTYKNLEILLINDCTPDDSINIAKELIVKYHITDKVQIINHEKNQGLSVARNTGIDLAKGNYIYFLDSDDCLTSNAIESLLKIALNTNSEVVMGEVDIVNPDHLYKVPNINTLYPDNTFLDNNLLIREGFFYKEWKETAWNKLINKDFLIQNNLYFEIGIYHEDTLWAFNLSLVVQRMAFSLDKTYIYFLRENSITTEKNQKHILDKIHIYNKFLDAAVIEQSLQKDISFLNYVGNFRLNLLFELSTKDYIFFKKSVEKMSLYPCFKIIDLKKRSLDKRVKMMVFFNFLPKKCLYNMLQSRTK